MSNLFETLSRKPVIGITLCHDNYGMIMSGVDYGFIRKEYGREVQAAGGVPLYIDEAADVSVIASLCDGVIISGGQDINPKFYGQEPSPKLGVIEPEERTVWEGQLIDACDRFGKHILGICYGSQLLNVHYGGTLYQDIAHEQGSAESHGSSQGAVMHEVTFAQDFLRFEKATSVPVASRHHQAVHDVAPGFSVAATAPDGVIEAISNGNHFGLQWHAESDGTSTKIYKSFVALCFERSSTETLPPHSVPLLVDA